MEPGPQGAPGTAGAPAYSSGSRIRARVVTTADGARGFAGWRDTSLGVDCFIGLSGDGRQRCLPTTPVQSGTYYADDQCAQRLATFASSCTPPAYALEGRAGGCGVSRFDVRPVTGTHDGPVYITTGAGCVRSTSLPVSGTVLLTVGATMDPGEFAEATESLEPAP
jgi:hypothetical protein